MNLSVQAAEIARIAEMLAYDPETGVFTRAVTTGTRWKKGDVAGSPDARGYIVLHVGGKVIKAHRLAWFKVHGCMPDGLVDHINGDPSDNRIANLRLASRSINGHNSEKRKLGVIGLRGVRRVAKSPKFAATITVCGKRKSLGCFDTPEEAHAQYAQAKSAVLNAGGGHAA